MSKIMNKDTFFKYREKLINLAYEIDNGNNVLDEYYKTLNSLLSYDLQYIFPINWNGIPIISDENHIADFSKTNAIIDFYYVNINGYANFKNCKICNLERIEGKMLKVIFDEQVYNDNPNMFLSDIFSESFKNKYNGSLLTLIDLAELNNNQLEELNKKNITRHINGRTHYNEFIKCIGLTNSIYLYKYSIDDYEYAESIFRTLYEYKTNYYLHEFDDKFIEVLKMKTIDATQISWHLDGFLTDAIVNKTFYDPIYNLINSAPERYKENHEEIYLRGVDMPNFLRKNWYNKSVNHDDFLEYIDLFKDTPFVSFVNGFNEGVIKFARKTGYEVLRLILKYHHDVFEYFNDNDQTFFQKYCENLPSNLNEDRFERWFLKVIKKYVYEHKNLVDSYINKNGKRKYILNSNFNSMNINILNSYHTINDFFHHSRYDLVLDDEQYKVLETFNINNLEKLCKETGILSLASPRKILKQVYVVLANRKEVLQANVIDYNEFCTSVVEWIEQLMYHGNIYLGNLDRVEGPFRERYPSIFMDKNAPDELKTTFYYCNINSKIVYEYKDYVKYLYDKNLKCVIKGNFEFLMENDIISTEENFLEYYSNRFGNPALLEIFTKYGFVFKRIGFSCLFSLNENMTKEEIDNKIVEYIYIRIIDYRKDGYIVYKDLKDVPEFYNEYPQIFLTEEDIELLNSKYKKNTVKYIEDEFYNYGIDSEFIQKYPILINILKNKNLKLIMDSRNNYHTSSDNNFYYSDYDIYYNLINYLGNETYLKALYKYGHYLEDSQEYLSDAFFDPKNPLDKGAPLEYYCASIEDAILKYCYLGYEYHPDDAPEFLKKKHPELFLAEDVPRDLYSKYYDAFSPINFNTVSNNPGWLPYLKDKRVSIMFLRKNAYDKDIISHYFKIFGENSGLMLGFRYPDTVNKMLHSTESVDLVKKWYDKTGGKFIPNSTVMQAFDIDEADKFLANGRKWSKLMNIKEFSYSDELVDALLKLAYVFGCFDDDSKGYNQLYKLLTESPKTISIDDFEKLKEKEDNSFAFRSVREQLGITGDKLSEKIYTQINENEYELTIDQSVNSDIFNKINNLLSSTINYPVLTADKAHALFGRFKLQYDPKFREFLFDNLSTILSDTKVSENIASIQRNFKKICAINSNRKLTLDMAVNYVSTMKYSEIDTVNDEVARISSIVGYEQEEFEILQQIYNYGKQRIYSSIPRTYNKIDEFHYEILRLDNPLPIAAGPLTDCCQELGDQAEWCMDHSMTSPDGRLFVVKDLEGNIIAQSWVWRNKNTICFDNIEIPNKVFKRYSNEYIAKKVYDIYKFAAEELVKKDNDKYKELLDKNIITMDEYNGLKLSKVTVGLGYNDISEVIKNNSKKDTDVMRPLDYKGPIKLTYGPYTNDSKVQYILKSTGANTVYNGKNLYIFNDDYQIFDKKSLDTKDLLNIISFDNLKYNYSDIMDSYEEDNTPMKSISDTYNSDIDYTRVLKSANFVIIYSDFENNVKLYDIMINSKVQINNKKIDITDIVNEQLSLALKQISDNNNFDITELDDDAKELFDSAIKIENKIKIK